MIFYKDGIGDAASVGIVKEQFDIDVLSQIASGLTWQEIIHNHFSTPVTNIQEWSFKLLSIFALWKFDEYSGGNLSRGGFSGSNVRGGWNG